MSKKIAGVLGAVFLALVVTAWPPSAVAGTKPEIQADEAFDADEFLDEENLEIDEETVADPLIGFNRAMFTFNDRLYFWLLKPVAKGYGAVVPVEVRTCLKNFFHNLAAPVRMVNALLQGKPRLAAAAFGAFFINTTAGLAGIGDLAARYPQLDPGDEDLGQTLGTYGMGNGVYLVLPLLGPSTLRDTAGLVGDRFLDPMTYTLTFSESAGANGLNVVNRTSFRIGEYESLKNAALEPYVAFRDGYIQYRRKKVAE